MLGSQIKERSKFSFQNYSTALINNKMSQSTNSQIIENLLHKEHQKKHYQIPKSSKSLNVPPTSFHRYQYPQQ